MQLTDELIQCAMDSISGLIVATTARRLHKSLADTQQLFLESKTCALLHDKETGYYWDSVPELLEKFIAEISRATPNSKT